jgi:hypothetical protein
MESNLPLLLVSTGRMMRSWVLRFSDREGARLITESPTWEVFVRARGGHALTRCRSQIVPRDLTQCHGLCEGVASLSAGFKFARAGAGSSLALNS